MTSNSPTPGAIGCRVLLGTMGAVAAGGGTLAYVLNGGRNWRMDLVYTITQNKPIHLRNGRKVWLDGFRQGRLTNPEVDVWSYHRSKSGLDYQLFSPAKGHGSPKGRKRPLVVWLHGGGGGAAPGASDNNETMLRANRGALGFSTAEAQRIFGGAYVVAPQSPTARMRNGRVYAPMVKGLVDELVKRHPIDASRVHVPGCSNGGYMFGADDGAVPRLVRVERADLRGARRHHRRRGRGHHHAHVARPLARRQHAAVHALGAVQRADQRVDPHLVRHRHLERAPVRRPLVADLRRPQRPPAQRRERVAVDGAPTPGITPH